MKQKIVIKTSIDSQKTRSKALKIVVGVLGVESATLGENDKNQIEVIGEGVDPVKLTSLLRKKLGKKWYLCGILPCGKVYAELTSVSSVEKKEEKKEEPKEQPVVWSYGCSMPQYGCSMPQYIIC